MYTASELLELINNHIATLKFERTPQGLYNPVSYVLSLGGKRIRPVLMLMAYNLYQEQVEAIVNQAMGIEVYHNYTLLHDDLMDRADKRRGKPTVHKVWNDNTAVLSGDAMLVLAYQLMGSCPENKLKQVLDLFSLTALEICEGQQIDMEFEQRNDVVEAEYIEMIRLKTSVLLAASLKIGAMLADAPAQDAQLLYDFGVNIGLAFQLKDDLLDVYGDTAVFGKNIGGDILCNKKTYLLIKALEHASVSQLEELNRWITAETFETDEKIAAVTNLYNQIGVKDLCEQQIAVYAEKAEACLKQLNLPVEKKACLEQLMNKLTVRKS